MESYQKVLIHSSCFYICIKVSKILHKDLFSSLAKFAMYLWQATIRLFFFLAKTVEKNKAQDSRKAEIFR